MLGSQHARQGTMLRISSAAARRCFKTGVHDHPYAAALSAAGRSNFSSQNLCTQQNCPTLLPAIVAGSVACVAAEWPMSKALLS